MIDDKIGNITNNKKGSVIYVLKILTKYSDRNHPLTYQQIIDKIKSEYGLEFERKSIANSIKLLQSLDYDIAKTDSLKGVFLNERLLEESEFTYIVDALFSSKSIPGNYAKALVDKLNDEIFSVYKKKYSYINKSQLINRTSNADVFITIEDISQCISEHRLFSFKYQTFDANGKQIDAYGGYRYFVSPYYLVNNYGRYYLLCHYRDKYGALQIFRIDYMKDTKVEKSQETVKDSKGEKVSTINYVPMSQIKELKDFDIVKYINEHVYLFGGEVIDAIVSVDNANSIKYIDDWFGVNNYKIINNSPKDLHVQIKCSEQALYYWLLQYGDYFKLLSPQSLVDKLKAHYEKQVAKY